MFVSFIIYTSGFVFHDVVYIAVFLKVDIDIKLFFIRIWKMLCTLGTKLKKGDEKYDKNV